MVFIPTSYQIPVDDLLSALGFGALPLLGLGFMDISLCLHVLLRMSDTTRDASSYHYRCRHVLSNAQEMLRY